MRREQLQADFRGKDAVEEEEVDMEDGPQDGDHQSEAGEDHPEPKPKTKKTPGAKAAAKSKAKAKAKAKAKPAAKAKGKAASKKPKVKGADKDQKDAKQDKIKGKDDQTKEKKKQKMLDEDVDHNIVPKSKRPKAGEPVATFARRYMPAHEDGKARYTAIKDVFLENIANELKCQSTFPGPTQLSLGSGMIGVIFFNKLPKSKRVKWLT